jgi:starch phosphorylase
VLADFESYLDCQDKVSKAWRDQEQWTRMSILNVAHMGKFSSDRSIHEYAKNIWSVQPVDLKAILAASK